MNVKRKKPVPSVRASFSGKEVKKLLKEFDELSMLYRYAQHDLETPVLDEFMAQLEETAGEYC